MATYVIGDIQGCLTELQDLLVLIDYKPGHDRLGFVGDLVNRGPDSLQTLRFIKQLDNPIVILGNHDIGLLALYYDVIAPSEPHTLTPILQAHDAEELMHWLAQQKIVEYLPTEDFFLVHAGIPPQWNKDQVLSYADELEQSLHGDHIKQYLSHMFDRQPISWNKNINKWDRLLYITNVFTRMRFCDASGELDVTNKSNKPSADRFKPWFEWYTLDTSVVFGHWAALKGRSTNPNCYAIDTACVWGESLTALRLEDKALFSVPSKQK